MKKKDTLHEAVWALITIVGLTTIIHNITK